MFKSIYFIVIFLCVTGVRSFVPTNLSSAKSSIQTTSTSLKAEESDVNDPAQIVGKRIILQGDVNGGYVRTCIHNEVSISYLSFGMFFTLLAINFMILIAHSFLLYKGVKI